MEIATLPVVLKLVFAAAAFAVLGLVALGVKRQSSTIRTVTIFVTFGLVLIWMVFLFAAPGDRWGCVLALLPGVMIFQHAVFLRLVRMPFRSSSAKTKEQSEKETKELDDEAKQALGAQAHLLPVFAAARRNSDRYFSPSTLAVRYGTPAVASAFIGVTVFYLLFTGDAGQSPDPNVHAARLGVAGAYTYVLLYLGQRNFRQDVTSGGAMWCAVMLAVGPVIAWAISHFAHGDFCAAPGACSAAKPAESGASSPELSSELLYFAAGLAPRHVAAFVEEAVRRIWVSPTSVTTATPRTIPITQVRGVTPGVAERFAEEGIVDLYTLSTADPLKLLRNTNFDKRQILAWMDEAILITTLPDQWQALEKMGFTGAIDVAWLYPAVPGVPPPFKPSPEQTSPDEQISPPIVDLVRLASQLKVDDVNTLYGVVQRLYTDAQLRLVWVLYQLIDRIDADSNSAT